MKQIVEFSSEEQTIILNELFCLNKDKYSLYDIFKFLPFDITFKDKRGYLSISQLGIEYTSITYDNKLNLVYVENTDYSSTNIFDCFIKAIKWFRNNKEYIVINFA